MINRDPEGYRKLLVYKKAAELQVFTNRLVANFPRAKTLLDLADQMSRSGRSGAKNIVEGWKRNTTKEYFTFLGFSIGAVEELKDDAADIATGVYPALMGLKGFPFIPLVPLYPLTRAELDELKFYPLDIKLPPIVQLFFRAKEVNYLLYKLQQSLDVKMDNEHTKPASQRFKNYFDEQKEADGEMEKYFKSLGLRRLENGQYVEEEKEQKEQKEDKGDNG